jgi:hypothetical protein
MHRDLQGLGRRRHCRRRSCLDGPHPGALLVPAAHGEDAGALVFSEAVPVAGFDGPLLALVSGEGSPELSVDGGAWTVSAAVSEGDLLQLRQTAHSASNTPRTASVLLGTSVVEWKVSTGSLEGAPLVTSTPSTTAVCGAPWQYDADGRVEVSSSEPVEFSVEAAPGDPLPIGIHVDSTSGEVDWSPAVRDRGLQRFVLVARAGAARAFQRVEVRVQCGAPIAVGCGCTGGLAWPSWMLLVLTATVALRRRPRERAP